MITDRNDPYENTCLPSISDQVLTDENDVTKTEDCVLKVPKTELDIDKNYVPTVENDVPKTEDYVPKTEDYVPKTEDYVPKTEDYASRTEDYASKTEDYVLKIEDDAPMTEDDSNLKQSGQFADILTANCYIRLRGCPFSATETDVRDFLGKEITLLSINFTQGYGGRPSGECYCELATVEDRTRALLLNKELMNNRYIEVFEVSETELAEVMRRVEMVQNTEGCVVRLRGLPFSASNELIREFLTGLQVAEVKLVKENGGEGRPTGAAYVRLASREAAEKALLFNRKHMGHRYIEVFRSSSSEMEQCNNPAFAYGHGEDYNNYDQHLYHQSYHQYGGGYDDYYGGHDGFFGPIRHSSYGGRGLRSRPYFHRGGPSGRGGPPMPGWGYPPQVDIRKVQMRGLPYRATAADIEAFFAPLVLVDILIGYGDDDRPSGDGTVEFETALDAQSAMSRNQKLMGKRYIELFLGSSGVPGVRSSQMKSIGGRGYSTPFGPTAPPSAFDPSQSTTGFENYSSIQAAITAAATGQQSYTQQYETKQQEYWRQYPPPNPPTNLAMANAQAISAATNSMWPSGQKKSEHPSWSN